MLESSSQSTGRIFMNVGYTINRTLFVIASLAFALFFQFTLIAQSARAEEELFPDTFVAIEDGPISKEFHLPSYEWYPKDKDPVGLILAVHGLTLHAKRFEVLGRASASAGFYMCACDMRGFGRCYTEPEKFSVGNDNKKKVDFQKSYLDLVQVATRMKKNHPSVPLFALGESMGTALCIKLAAEHPELVDGLILSGPTVKVHPLMFLHPSTMAAGAFAVFIDPKFKVSMSGFVKNLVSNDPNIVQEMLNDPLCRKQLTIKELLNAKKFADKTLPTARKLKHDEHILVIQDSHDLCMVPHAVTSLSKRIHSSDQTIRWLHANGHLLLETAYLKPATIEALSNWIEQHDAAHEAFAKHIQDEMILFGAKRSPSPD